MQASGDAEGSDWDDDDAKKKKAIIPEGRAKHGSLVEASGFDDDEKQAVAMTFNMTGDESKGVAMSFDMSSDKPVKAMPRGLQDRLSRPKSAKKKEKAGTDDQPMTKEEKKEAAKALRKKSRTILAPTKQVTTTLPPPSLKPHMKAGARPPAITKQETANANPVEEDDACGAPSRPTGNNFVAARPKPAAETAVAEAGADGSANDFLSDLLNTDTSAPSASIPFKGSSNHGFVPDFHCTGCDHQVMRIENNIWKGDVPYMFLRNNYPNVMRLREHLKSQQGCSAYCCQCSSRAGDTGAALEDIAEGLRWRVVTG